MTLLMTAPERISIMAQDASPLIKGGSHLWVQSLDDVQRPFVLVEIGDGDYPPAANSIETPLESFTLQVISHKYGQSTYAAAEEELRQVVVDIIGYFSRRPTLVFSNVLQKQPGALPALNGVQWARLRRRGLCSAVTKNEEEGAFWGATMAVDVQSVAQAYEVLH